MKRNDFFSSGLSRISCVCTVPGGQKMKAGLIFVHAANGNRLGPHRMFVEFSGRLKYSEIASLRFDMRGCGDSTGEPTGKDLNSDIEDLRNAINFFTSQSNPPKIFLLGISRGASVCLSALAEHRLPVHGAILLSTPVSGSKAAAKKFSSRLKEYLYKFRNPESLQKLLSGKANFKQIFKTLTFALSSPKRYRQNNDGFSTQCSLFFIYGSKDPIMADSQTHYRKICERHKIPYRITEIKNANHSFFHYRWKEQVMDMSQQWLLDNIADGEKNADMF